MARQRLFIAVNLPPPPALQPILAELARMGEAVRPTDARQLHVTLAFLGEIDEADTALIGDALRRAACQLQAFDAVMTGLGVFPNMRRPRVLWAGFADEQPWRQLKQAVDDALAAERILWRGDDRPWSPHATLARLRSRGRQTPIHAPRRFDRLLQTHRDEVFGPVAIQSLQLMASELLPDGARHTALSIAPLNR